MKSIVYLLRLETILLPSMGKQEFKDFYKAALKLSEEEWIKFKETLECPLPRTFRIRKSHEREISNVLLKEENFIAVNGLKDAYFFGNNYNNEIINALNSNGLIQRSELVSMLAPYFLLYNTDDIDVVIDICASPGNKTKILMDSLAYKKHNDAILIANDVSNERVTLLASEMSHNISHLNYCVTKANAMSYPYVLNHKVTHILCDVPCTCDGTIRKTPKIIDSWNIQDSIGIHRLQYEILKRAIQLQQITSYCKEVADSYAYCVYSTCSLNPIENEYVVDKILKEFINVELLDSHTVGDKLFNGHIKLREGLTTFNYKNFIVNNDELKKCARIYPMDNNTSGFFIAYLKVKPLNNRNNIKKINNQPIRSKLLHISKFGKNYVSCSKNESTLYQVTKDMNKFLSDNRHLAIEMAGIKVFNKSKEAGNYTPRPTKEFFNMMEDYSAIESKFLEQKFRINENEFIKLINSEKVKRNDIREFMESSYVGKFTAIVENANITIIGNLSRESVSLLLSAKRRNLYKLYFQKK